MGSQAQQLHVFFFPVMAQGHMIPMIDMARIFAARGTKSTIITTPLNALNFSENIARDRESGLDIDVEIIPFPTREAGLPLGCENLSFITSETMVMNFFMAVGMLQQPFEKLLEQHRPQCVVSDMFLPWTTELASKYGIPRIVFNGTSNFSLCLTENIRRYAPQMNAKSGSEIFVVPNLPDQVEMTKLQLPDHGESKFLKVTGKIQESELKSFGVLQNSFYELEPTYADYLRNDVGRRAWNIGPVSLYNKNIIDKTHRGKKASIDENYCLKWLDSQKPNSVLYVSFGSISRFGTAQLQEIERGLEASNIPFVWVIRKIQNESQVQVVQGGVEEGRKGKGMIIQDWAPQMLILEHQAVGGFMTHCGWNSVLEGISAGVPFITWPMFAEQFNNEKLVTQVLKIGVSAGNEIWKFWVDQEDVSVTKERIEKVVVQLMGDGQEAQDMRQRAKELEEMAKNSVTEGGSSYNSLSDLLEELRLHSQQSTGTK